MGGVLCAGGSVVSSVSTDGDAVIAGGGKRRKRGDLYDYTSTPSSAPLFHPAMVSKRQKRAVDDDPLARAMAPPPNESAAERDLRIAAEQEAKRVSDAIDEELNRQRIADKKNPRPVKILLLGASSSCLACFTATTAPTSDRPERIWYVPTGLPGYPR